MDPVVVELREWSRIAEELTRDRARLANRVREQLWRYYPQLLDVGDERRAAVPPRSVGPGAGSWKSCARRRFRSLRERPRPPWPTSAAPRNVSASRSGNSATPGAKSHACSRGWPMARTPGPNRPAGSATSRSSPPCPESAGPCSPRSSPRPPSPCADAIARRSGACAEWLPSRGGPANRPSSSAASPPTPACATHCTTGPEPPSTTTRRARPSTRPFARAATVTPARFASVADRLLAVACAMLRTLTVYDPGPAQQPQHHLQLPPRAPALRQALGLRRLLRHLRTPSLRTP